MKALDVLLPRILPRAKNCPEPTALAGIRTAAIEFCERTRLWRGTDSAEIEADGLHTVVVPSDAVLHEIESARFNGLPIDPVAVSWLDDEVLEWRTRTGSLGKWFTQLEPGTVRVVPAAEGTLDLSLFLKPAETALLLPDFMLDVHARTLADGALAEILTIPGQPFFSAELAMFHAGRFKAELDRLCSASIKGQQRAPARTRPQFF